MPLRQEDLFPALREGGADATTREPGDLPANSLSFAGREVPVERG